MSREVTGPLVRRIGAAVADAAVSRAAVDFDWPECHRKKCPHLHGNIDSAFTSMKLQIIESVRSELLAEATTRPDMDCYGDTREQVAVYTMAHLLNTYNVHHAGTFVKAAQLMVDAYPALVDALQDVEP